MKDKTTRSSLFSFKDLSDTQMKELMNSSCAVLMVVVLTAISLLGGIAFGGAVPGSAGEPNRFDLTSFKVASAFDMETAAVAFREPLPSLGLPDADSVELASAPSAFGEFYDVSDVDPNAVCTINIDGRKVVYMRSAADAQAVLDGIISRYTEGNSQIQSVNFAEQVEIVVADDYVTAEMAQADKTVTETYLCQVEEAINYIMNGTSQAKTYVVQGGDTMWDIAIRNGLSPYELAAMNPAINCDRLSIGDVLNLYEVKPFVNVTTVEIASETESIPFTTIYTQTADLYKGQTSITSAGSNGSKVREVEYVKQNGVVISSTVLSEEIVSQPVTQYAMTGTTAMPIKTGSGSLISPVGSTSLSSSAGAYGASRGGRRHAGADLKANCGDPIVASDAGTVIFAGYSGSYGYIVKINHGNGIETRYAHCQSLLVSYGDNVEKGQQIATVGKTGNATGYLCHFEILVNGSTVNPLNYI